MDTKNAKVRLIIVVALMFVIFVLFAIRLIKLQLIDGETYLEQSQRRVSQLITVKAPRGEISDRLGRPFVVNSNGITIQFERVQKNNDIFNKEILDLINLFGSVSAQYNDTLPITRNEPFEYVLTESPDTTSQSDAVKNLLVFLELPEKATAEQAINKLGEKYSLGGYAPADIRKIASIRYQMELRGFSDSNPFVFAGEADMQIVTLLEENSSQYPEVSVVMEPIRQYVAPGVASHILGRIGQIFAEEYPALKEQNYSLNDIVGKDGIEKVAEQYLRGKNGTKRVDRDIDGNITQVAEVESAVSGNNVFLTLDKDLQIIAEQSLKRTIEETAAKYQTSKKPGYDANAGAVVAVDVHTGDILALASYPTYDLSAFNKDYATLLADPLKPMLNRTISGTYAPGSTYKMVTATAALETNTIDTKYRFTCTGTYTHFAPYLYTDYNKHVHGSQNVVQGLQNSCNSFFFEIGRLAGIEAIETYAKKYGLGDYTGIELAGEAKGVISGKEEKTKRGEIWYPADTIQSAIGQLDNLFTPVQLASYVSTIANKGTRNKLHLIKSVKSYYYGETVYESKTETVDSFSMQPQNYNAIVDGMRKVIEEGTASGSFNDFNIPLAGKTGTAEVPGGSATGVFVGFAPVDDPQIAIVVVIEHAGLGANTAPVVKDVLSAYFSAKETQDKIRPEGVLIQ